MATSTFQFGKNGVVLLAGLSTPLQASHAVRAVMLTCGLAGAMKNQCARIVRPCSFCLVMYCPRQHPRCGARDAGTSWGGGHRRDSVPVCKNLAMAQGAPITACTSKFSNSVTAQNDGRRRTDKQIVMQASIPQAYRHDNVAS